MPKWKKKKKPRDVRVFYKCKIVKERKKILKTIHGHFSPPDAVFLAPLRAKMEAEYQVNVTGLVCLIIPLTKEKPGGLWGPGLHLLMQTVTSIFCCLGLCT